MIHLKGKKTRVIGFITITFVLLVLSILTMVYFYTASLYKSNFNMRYTTKPSERFYINQFEGLTSQQYTFKSNNNQNLVAYLYKNNDNIYCKGTVIFAHGLGGGGQNGYMDIFDHLTKHGYYVFAYDATANDESEGESVGGLPQGIIDLDYAISFAKTLEDIGQHPISLMGYSWGGLSVSNSLNYHRDIDSIISVAGFNKTENIIEHRAEEVVGKASKMVVPFASLHEMFTYGNYAFSSAMKSFANTDCRVMIIHSEDDQVVPIQYGYDTYYREYKDDPRFVFKRYTDRGHDVLKCSDGTLDTLLIDEIIDFLDKNN